MGLRTAGKPLGFAPSMPRAVFSTGARCGVLVAIVVLVSGPGEADYRPFPLFELIATAELIVVGTIAEVNDDTFRLKTTKVIRGTAADEIEIKRFIDWNGNDRWADYQRGQELLLFLFRESQSLEAAWLILGAGGQGEMLFEGEAVYCHGLFLAGFPQKKYSVQGGQLTGYRFSREVFLAAVEEYSGCFRMKEGQSGKPRRLVKNCPDETLEAYRTRSALHRFLIDQSVQAISRRQNQTGSPGEP